MSCPHVSDAIASIRAPRAGEHVHREECTLCFDDQDGSEGIDVCLSCFNGSCTAPERNHSSLHLKKSGHPLVLNVKRRRKPKKVSRGDVEPPLKKLAIVAESDADKYEYVVTPKCLVCDAPLPKTDELNAITDKVMASMTSAQQSEVKAWEEEIISCQHASDLNQFDGKKLEPEGLAHCAQCELNSNLWLCLTCGNLGCGRQQYAGVGGHGHGLAHYEQTGHPVSVKQGTITAEGTADIYCYSCNDARLDPHLAKHLANFGINVMDLSKTEKSMTELQVEQNLNFDFSMTGDDGKALEPLFGPGLTGLRNLGNSCYMASVLQAVFSIPSFQSRYLLALKAHVPVCGQIDPASCLECQMAKMADGLLSGRYAIPRRPDDFTDTHTPKADGDSANPSFQEGIHPAMFKALVGKGHPEFATMRQQDADEFFKYFIDLLQREGQRAADNYAKDARTSVEDPTKVFSFALQQKLQCNECRRVRYTIENQDAGISVPVPVRDRRSSKGPTTDDGPSHGPRSDGPDFDSPYEAVTLEECLDIFTAPETLDYRCPACDKVVTATKQTMFATFPNVLMVHVRRFQLLNWVPQKVDVPVMLHGASLTLDKYLGRGKAEDEVELPEDKEARSVDDAHVAMVTELGFTPSQALKALKANNNDIEQAVAWLFENPDASDEPTQGADSNISNTSVVHGSNALPAKYNLTAFINHKGPSVHSGHYVATIKKNLPSEGAVASQQWVFFNDEKVGKGGDNLAPFSYVYMFTKDTL